MCVYTYPSVNTYLSEVLLLLFIGQHRNTEVYFVFSVITHRASQYLLICCISEYFGDDFQVIDNLEISSFPHIR